MLTGIYTRRTAEVFPEKRLTVNFSATEMLKLRRPIGAGGQASRPAGRSVLPIEDFFSSRESPASAWGFLAPCGWGEGRSPTPLPPAGILPQGAAVQLQKIELLRRFPDVQCFSIRPVHELRGLIVVRRVNHVIHNPPAVFPLINCERI